MHGNEKRYIRIFAAKLEGRRPLAKFSPGWETIFKWIVKNWI
jgi:hypothetical protein